MLVKCWDIGEKRPREEAYKAPNKKYYSCEEAYLNMVNQTEWRNKCTEYMQEIMGYDADMKLPTRWYKFLNEFAKYGFDVVYDTIDVNKNTFLWALDNKSFKNDSHALSYFNAIIQNSIMEQYRKKKLREKAEQQRRQDEIHIETENIATSDLGQDAVKGKDLSGLLGDIF